MIGNQLVLGLQLEGGLSNIQARLTGTNATTSTSSSYSTSTSICPACVPPNPTSTSISNSSSSGVNSVADSLATRWLASALARGGFLIGPTDLIYAIGGYTYAGFETPQNFSSFGLHGGTIGGGYEKKSSPLWSIKAEYRYTKFRGKTVDLPYTSTSTGTGGGNTSTYTSNSNNFAHFTADIQAVFVGVSRSLRLTGLISSTDICWPSFEVVSLAASAFFNSGSEMFAAKVHFRFPSESRRDCFRILARPLAGLRQRL